MTGGKKMLRNFRNNGIRETRITSYTKLGTTERKKTKKAINNEKRTFS